MHVPGRSSGQSRHGTATGYKSDSYFKLREDCLFAAGEAHVARKCQLASDAGRGHAPKQSTRPEHAQPHKQVGSCAKPVGPAEGSLSPRARKKVVVREENPSTRCQDDNLDLLISLERRDDLVQLRMVSGPKMLRGGWSNVTLQYVGDRRARRISLEASVP